MIAVLLYVLILFLSPIYFLKSGGLAFDDGERPADVYTRTAIVVLAYIVVTIVFGVYLVSVLTEEDPRLFFSEDLWAVSISMFYGALVYITGCAIPRRLVNPLEFFRSRKQTSILSRKP